MIAIIDLDVDQRLNVSAVTQLSAKTCVRRTRGRTSSLTSDERQRNETRTTVCNSSDVFECVRYLKNSRCLSNMCCYYRFIFVVHRDRPCV